eukprot:373415-Pleurochrysis_carterae.AAC.2
MVATKITLESGLRCKGDGHRWLLNVKPIHCSCPWKSAALAEASGPLSARTHAPSQCHDAWPQ